MAINEIELWKNPWDTFEQKAVSWAAQLEAMTFQGRKQRFLRAAVEENDVETVLRDFGAWIPSFGRSSGKKISKNTVIRYQEAVEKFWKWMENRGLKIHQATKDTVKLWIQDSQANGYGVQTVRADLCGVKKFFLFVEWMGVKVEAPTDGVFPPHDPRPVTQRSRGLYSQEEVETLLRECGMKSVRKGRRAHLKASEGKFYISKRDRVLILLAAHGGLRAEEAATLTWGDVDLTQGVMTPAQKGGGNAPVHISRSLSVALVELKATYSIISGKNEEELRKDTVLQLSSRQHLNVRFNHIRKLAEVPAHGYHGLRHTCGTHFYKENGNDLLVTAQHLRHRNPMSATIYARPDQDKIPGVLENW